MGDKQIFHDRAFDVRRKIVNEAYSVELTIINLYPTSGMRIVVLIKTLLKRRRTKIKMKTPEKNMRVSLPYLQSLE